MYEKQKKTYKSKSKCLDYGNDFTNNLMKFLRFFKFGRIFEYKLSEHNLNMTRRTIENAEKKITDFKNKEYQLSKNNKGFISTVIKSNQAAKIRSEISNLSQQLKNLQSEENNLISYRLKNYPYNTK